MKISRMLQSIYDARRPNQYALKPYLINDGKRHPFAVICPGGGYGMVCSAGEGSPFAKELNKLGYHAFVVYYRVKRKARYPQPQEDLKRAIEEIFARADELEAVGLDIPQITKLCLLLRAGGMPMPAGLYTTEAAEDALMEIFRSIKNDREGRARP